MNVQAITTAAHVGVTVAFGALWLTSRRRAMKVAGSASSAKAEIRRLHVMLASLRLDGLSGVEAEEYDEICEHYTYQWVAHHLFGRDYHQLDDLQLSRCRSVAEDVLAAGGMFDPIVEGELTR